MNNKKKMIKNILLAITIVVVLGTILYLIYIEDKKFKENSLKNYDRPVIINQNTSFDSRLVEINPNLEDEIFDIDRIKKIENFLEVIYGLNKDKDCELTNVIFKEKSGKITYEELFTPYNFKLLNKDSLRKEEFYSYEGQAKIKNEYEKKIEKFLFDNGKIQDMNINYQVIKTDIKSLQFYKDYFGFTPSLSDISNYSNIEKKIINVEEDNNHLLTAVVLLNKKEDNKCNLSEVKKIIRVTEDSEYIYVYISYLKYDSSKLDKVYAVDKALNNGPNYRLLLKKDKDKYYLDRYEYLK